jgi:hypothetical protein
MTASHSRVRDFRIVLVCPSVSSNVHWMSFLFGDGTKKSLLLGCVSNLHCTAPVNSWPDVHELGVHTSLATPPAVEARDIDASDAPYSNFNEISEAQIPGLDSNRQGSVPSFCWPTNS